MSLKQVIVVRNDLKMGKGKTAAQCAHASVEGVEKALKEKPEWVKEWKGEGQEKVVVKVESKKEFLELFELTRKKFPSALIKDAGRTQIKAGEATCFALGPAPEKKLDEFTKKLKLL